MENNNIYLDFIRQLGENGSAVDKSEQEKESEQQDNTNNQADATAVTEVGSEIDKAFDNTNAFEQYAQDLQNRTKYHDASNKELLGVVSDVAKGNMPYYHLSMQGQQDAYEAQKELNKRLASGDISYDVQPKKEVTKNKSGYYIYDPENEHNEFLNLSDAQLSAKMKDVKTKLESMSGTEDDYADTFKIAEKLNEAITYRNENHDANDPALLSAIEKENKRRQAQQKLQQQKAIENTDSYKLNLWIKKHLSENDENDTIYNSTGYNLGAKASYGLSQQEKIQIAYAYTQDKSHSLADQKNFVRGVFSGTQEQGVDPGIPRYLGENMLRANIKNAKTEEEKSDSTKVYDEYVKIVKSEVSNEKGTRATYVDKVEKVALEKFIASYQKASADNAKLAEENYNKSFGFLRNGEDIEMANLKRASQYLTGVDIAGLIRQAWYSQDPNTMKAYAVRIAESRGEMTEQGLQKAQNDVIERFYKDCVKYVKDDIPEGVFGVIQNAFANSIAGNFWQGAIRWANGNNNELTLLDVYQQRLQEQDRNYNKNGWSGAAKLITSKAFQMGFDTPFFGGIGKVASSATKPLLKPFVSKWVPKSVYNSAFNAFASTGGGRLLVGVTSGAMTGALFNPISMAAQSFATGQSASFGDYLSGAATGALHFGAMGLTPFIGNYINKYNNKLFSGTGKWQTIARTMGNVVVQDVISPGLNAAIVTGLENWMEIVKHGISPDLMTEYARTFGEFLGMHLGGKVSHIGNGKLVNNLKAMYGYKTALQQQGFTKSELEAINNSEAVGKVKSIITESASIGEAEMKQISELHKEIIADNTIPEGAKLKLFAIVGDSAIATPTITKVDRVEEGGKHVVKVYTAEGKLFSSNEFSSKRQADNEVLRISNITEKNKILATQSIFDAIWYQQVVNEATRTLAESKGVEVAEMAKQLNDIAERSKSGAELSSDDKALKKEFDSAIKNAVNNTTLQNSEQLKNSYNTVGVSIDSILSKDYSQWTKSDKELVSRYVDTMNNAIAKDNERKDAMIRMREVESVINQSFDEGKSLEEPQSINETALRVNALENILGEHLTDELRSEILNEPVSAYERVANDENLSAPVKERIIEYIKTRAKFDGFVSSVNDRIDGEVEASNTAIDAITHKSEGNVIEVEVTDNAGIEKGKKVYVVNGKLSTNGNSFVDLENSDKTIAIIVEGDEKPRMISPSKIVRVVSNNSAEELKNSSRDEIIARISAESDNAVNGTINSVAVGDKISIANDEGNVVEAEVVQPTDQKGNPIAPKEGEVFIKVGEDIFPISLEQLSIRAGNAKYNAISNEYRMEPEPTREAEIEDAEVNAETAENVSPEANKTPETDSIPQQEYKPGQFTLNENGEEKLAIVTGNVDEQGRIQYLVQGENEFRYATKDEMRKIAKDYKPYEDAEAEGDTMPEADAKDVDNAEQREADNEAEVVEQKVADEFPVDENGKKDYVSAGAERTAKHIYDELGLEKENADELVENNIASATEELANAEKAKEESLKGVTDPDEMASLQKSANEAVNKAKQKKELWEGVKAERAKEKAENNVTPSLLDAVRTLYSKGKEVASKLFQRSFFDVAQTPKFMNELGLRGDKFTIKYGVIARHLGKDGSHALSEKDWEQLPQALQEPFAISRLTDKDDSYRIYTTLLTDGGEFVVVGADVKNAGREIEVNAISTVFGRRNNANLSKNEEVIYRSEEITPEQSSLLERPNFAQYPTEQELYGNKGSESSADLQEVEDKLRKLNDEYAEANKVWRNTDFHPNKEYWDNERRINAAIEGEFNKLGDDELSEIINNFGGQVFYIGKRILYRRKVDDLQKLSDEELQEIFTNKGELWGKAGDILEERNELKLNIQKHKEILEEQGEISGNAKKSYSLYKYIDKTERPQLGGVYHKDGYAIATDTHVLVADKRKYDKENDGRIIDKDGNEIEGGFPNVFAVVPRRIIASDIDAMDLLNFIAGVKNVVKSKKEKLKDKVILFNVGDELWAGSVENLEKFANAAVSLGGKIYFHNSKGGRIGIDSIYTESDKGFALMMPIDFTRDSIDKENYFAYKPSEMGAETDSMVGKEKHQFGEGGELRMVQELTDGARKQMQTVARSLGVDLVFDDTLKENGRYTTIDKATGRPTIHVAMNASNPLESVFGHEATHRVKSLDSESYSKLHDVARLMIGDEEFFDRANQKKELYAKNGITLSDADAREEVVSDYIGSLIYDKEHMGKVADKLSKPILSKIRDVVSDFLDYFRRNKMTADERLAKGSLRAIDRAFARASNSVQNDADGTKFSLGDTVESFKNRQKRAVENRGTVMPGLNESEVKVVNVDRDENGKLHPFDESLSATDLKKQVKEYASAHGDEILGETDFNGGKVVVSLTSLSEMVDPKSIHNSVNKELHLGALLKIKEIISNSIDAEVHPDYTEKDLYGRRIEGKSNPDVLIHRLYGAVNIDGVDYRVKTTVKELNNDVRGKAYTYEVTNIELLEDHKRQDKSPTSRTTNNSMSVAKLLNGVEKSYDKGKKLLDESKNNALSAGGDKFSLRKGGKEYRNNGYTQREDGSNISVRAQDAEEEGSFSKGNFAKHYGVAKNDFEVLNELGIIKNTEWHHTGVNFGKTDFYSWKDSERADGDVYYGEFDELPDNSFSSIYKANKSEISNLVKESNSKGWTNVPNVENDAESLADFYSNDAKGKPLMKLMQMFGYSSEEASRRIYSAHINYLQQSQMDRANKASNDVKIVYDAKIALEKGALDKWVNKAVKDGKATFVERVITKPENFVETKVEMKGRYGWYKPTHRHTGTKYYSGYSFSTKRMLDSYNKRAQSVANLERERAIESNRAFDAVMSEDYNPSKYSLREGVSELDEQRKEEQFKIINQTNPAHDDYHTWIRSKEDILTLQEAVDEVLKEDPEYELSAYPDVSDAMIREALETGEITVYSSYPIENGVFVSPSKMQAKDYAGRGKVYSKVVPINDVAWITPDEGQMASVESKIPVTKYQIIGEKGADALDKANEATIRMDNLSVAREMEKAGKDAKAIRLATGWERGADKKWRYEVKDGMLKNNPNLKEHRDEDSGEVIGYTTKLGELLDNEELFKAYPQLRDMPIGFQKLGNMYAGNYEANTIIIDIHYLEHSKPSERKQKRLREIENTDEYKKWLKVYSNKSATAEELDMADEEFDSTEVGKEYDRLTSLDYVDNGKVELKFKDKDKHILSHEIQHAIQDIEGFAEGGSPERMRKEFNIAKREVDARIWMRALQEKAKDAENKSVSEIENELIKDYKKEGLSEFIPDWRARNIGVEYFNRGYYDDSIDTLINRYNLDVSLGKDFDAYKAYNRIAGEVESRNVEERMKMSEQERRETLLADTEDVSRKDQIFLFNNLGESQMGSRVDKRMAEVGEYFDGRKLSDNERAVVDVFSGKSDNKAIIVERDGKQHKVVMRQGNENKAGTKHSLFRHYGTNSGVISSEDLLIVPQVIERGEKEMKGNGIAYKLKKDGVVYTVYNEIQNGQERFCDFYTNKKGGSTSLFNTQLSAQDYDATTSNGANLVKENETASGFDKFSLREDAVSLKSILNDRTIGLKEQITLSKALLAEQNKSDKTLLNDFIRSVTDNLSDVRKAMSAQKVYDQATVKRVADLAKIMLSTGHLSNLGKGEQQRLLSAVKNSAGAKDNDESVQKIMDIMVSNQLNNGELALEELESKKGTKLDSSRVQHVGELDPAGNIMLDAFKKCRKMSDDKLSEQIGEYLDKMDSSDEAIADNASNAYAGAMIAKLYHEKIRASIEDEQTLQDSLDDVSSNKELKKNNPEAYRQLVDSINDAITQNRIDRAQAYFDLVGMLTNKMKDSAENAKQFKEAEKQRVKNIHHIANSDMQGRRLRGDRKDNTLEELNNFPVFRFLASPLANLDQMLRMLGGKNSNGRGYLWNHFMRGWVDSADKEQVSTEKYYELLDKKAAEIFGEKGYVFNGNQIKRAYKYTDLYSYAEDLPKATVSYFDGGEMRDYSLTQAELLYLYAVEKMPLGRATNRKMGISEDVMEQITNVLDEKLKRFADWTQEELLPSLGNDMNAVHRKMFGANMDSIENYFPFVRDKKAIKVEVENGNLKNFNDKISVKTGAIKKRTANVIKWDMPNCNFFKVLAKHVDEGCHWMGFAELNKDFSTLLSYNRFKQQVMNINSVYGNGSSLWKTFTNVCAIATDAYEPKRSESDELMVRIAKNVTLSKIAFNPMPAIKQLLSLPAFFGEVKPQYIMQSLLRGGVADVKWAWENLPNYRKRVKSRMVGDYYLRDSEFEKKGGVVGLLQSAGDKFESLAKKGMVANIGIDAWTIAVGAYGAYRTAKDKYLRWGMSEEKAEERAKQDATLCYNKSQQSSEGPFMSKVQIDHTFFSTMMMLFRNAATSYTRETHASLRNLKRLVSGEVDYEYMAKQILRQAEIPTFSKLFDSELNRQAEGTLANDHDYSLGTPGGKLQSAGILDKPIKLFPELLSAVAEQNGLEVKYFSGLVDAINNPVAVHNEDGQTRIVIETDGGNDHCIVDIVPNEEGYRVTNIEPLSNHPNGYKVVAESLLDLTAPRYINQGKAKRMLKMSGVLSEFNEEDAEAISNIANYFVNPMVPEQQNLSGWRKEDIDNAKKQAKREIVGSTAKNIVNTAIFGLVLPWAWRIGGAASLLLLSGDDDEKQEVIDDANRKAVTSGLEGIAYGDVVTDGLHVLWDRFVNGNKDAKLSYLGRNNPFYSDMSTMLRHMDRDVMQGCADIINIFISSMTGVNPQLVSNWTAAWMDKASGNRELSNEWGLFAARLVNTPKSQLENIYFEEVGLMGSEASNYTPEQLAMRFANYQVRRGYSIIPSSCVGDSAFTKQKNYAFKIIKEKMNNSIDKDTQQKYEQFSASINECKKKVGEAKNKYINGVIDGAQLFASLQYSKDYDIYRKYAKYDAELTKVVNLYLNCESTKEAKFLINSIRDIRRNLVESYDATLSGDSDKENASALKLDESVAKFWDDYYTMNPKALEKEQRKIEVNKALSKQ